MSDYINFDFFCYFDEILKNKNISMNAKVVFLYLCRCHGRDGKIHPKIKTISERIGLSLTRTKYALKELLDQGLIKSSRTGRSNRYELLLIKDSPDMGHHDSPNVTNQNSDSPKVGHRDSPKMNHYDSPNIDYQGSDSPKTEHHDSPNVNHQMARKQAIPNKKTKRKQKRNNNVVVSPQISLLLDRVREGVNLEDQGLIESLKEGLEEYGYEPMIERIEYVNLNANGNYPGFLATMIRKGWGVPEVKKSQPTPPSKHLPSANAFAGKTILYEGEQYIVDPHELTIRPKSGGVLPIGIIRQSVEKGSIKLINNS